MRSAGLLTAMRKTAGVVPEALEHAKAADVLSALLTGDDHEPGKVPSEAMAVGRTAWADAGGRLADIASRTLTIASWSPVPRRR